MAAWIVRSTAGSSSRSETHSSAIAARRCNQGKSATSAMNTSWYDGLEISP